MFEQKRHPIRIVARRTGLSPEVIRVWERRYGTVSPARTETGRRVYSDADIERLRLVRLATSHGRRISDVSEFTLDALRTMAREDDEAELSSSPEVARVSPRVPSPSPMDLPRSPGADLVEESIRAVRNLDAPRLEAALHRGLMALGSTDFIEGLVAPLMHKIGSLWEHGEIDTSVEHLATSVVRQTIARRLIWPAAEASAPLLVVATPVGQVHEMGAILAASTAQSQGWRVLYLGANLPARDIARASIRVDAKAVALSFVYPLNDSSLGSELEILRTGLSDGVSILAGGPGVSSYESALSNIGAYIVPDTRAFRSRLSDLAKPKDSSVPAS